MDAADDKDDRTVIRPLHAAGHSPVEDDERKLCASFNLQFGIEGVEVHG